MSVAAATAEMRRYSESQIAGQRRRSAARHRALARLAREYPERYAQLYAEERGESP